MFEEMGFKTFYILKLLDDPQRTNAIFQGQENLPYDIFINLETKPIIEALGDIYSGIKKLDGFLKKINLL